jgi:hypothetical protein
MRRGDTAKVLVRPIAGSDRLKVVDVRSESNAVRVAATEEKGAVIVTIDIKGKMTPPRYSLVRCELESLLGRHGGATVVIEGLDER